MPDDIERRAPFRPESLSLHGPGVAMWDRYVEHNDHPATARWLDRREELGADFVSGIAPLLRELAAK